MKRKEEWSEPNLHEDMFQPLIFQGAPQAIPLANYERIPFTTYG